MREGSFDHWGAMEGAGAGEVKSGSEVGLGGRFWKDEIKLDREAWEESE